MRPSPVAARLDAALCAAGLAIDGVSIHDEADRSTWTVHPATLQAAAQPIIDTFNPDDPAHERAELDAQVKSVLDNERLISAVVWCVIDTLAGPATKAKYGAARAKILTAYLDRPWR